jgi:hypothetical protein
VTAAGGAGEIHKVEAMRVFTRPVTASGSGLPERLDIFPKESEWMFAVDMMKRVFLVVQIVAPPHAHLDEAVLAVKVLAMVLEVRTSMSWKGPSVPAPCRW